MYTDKTTYRNSYNVFDVTALLLVLKPNLNCWMFWNRFGDSKYLRSFAKLCMIVLYRVRCRFMLKVSIYRIYMMTALSPTMLCWPRMKASTTSEVGSAGGVTGFSLASLWASRRAVSRRAARWAASTRAACSCATWALPIPSWSCGDAAPAE